MEPTFDRLGCPRGNRHGICCHVPSFTSFAPCDAAPPEVYSFASQIDRRLIARVRSTPFPHH
jgi:hypothetical protein